MPIIYKPRTRYNATNGIQSTITVADHPSGYGGQPHTMASRHYQSHSCVPVVCTILMFRMILCIQFYRLMQLIFSTLLKGIIRKECQSFQTTDTIKRHQRYSIRYHCGWPSLGIWGSATHNGLPALPEPFLRACGLHNPDVQDDSMYSILSIDATYFFNITIDKLTIYML